MQTKNLKQVSPAKRGIPLWLLIQILLITTLLFYTIPGKLSSKQLSPKSQETVFERPSPVLNRITNSSSSMVQPLLYIDYRNDDPHLAKFKFAANELIQNTAGINQTSTSVYLCDLNNDGWTGVHNDIKIKSDAMYNLPKVIAILSEIESQPQELKRKVVLPASVNGQREIALSDLLKLALTEHNLQINQALNNLTPENLYFRLFSDLKLKRPESIENAPMLSLAEYSRFLKILFNSTYLNNDFSEYTLQLLEATNYEEGINRKMNASDLKAHLFDVRKSEKFELIEIGIVYFEDNPFMLAVNIGGNEKAKVLALASDIGAKAEEIIRNNSKSK